MYVSVLGVRQSFIGNSIGRCNSSLQSSGRKYQNQNLYKPENSDVAQQDPHCHIPQRQRASQDKYRHSWEVTTHIFSHWYLWALLFRLVDLGGDWDRRNRLKVYKGVYSLMARDLETAATLFLVRILTCLLLNAEIISSESQDSVATFTSAELISYNDLILYTVITSVLCMDRPTLRKRVKAMYK